MRRITLIAAVAATIGAGASASAQVNRPLEITPTNISVRAGVVLPIDDKLRNVASTLLGLGAEYTFDRPLLQGGETYLSVDYFNKGLSGSKGTVWPICINQRFYTGNRGGGRRTYGFLGLGIAIIDVNRSNTVVAARGGFGAELGDALFFETAAVLSDKGDVARANSVGFYIGYRF